MHSFQSKVKFQGVLVVPILASLIVLLIPQIHWLAAIPAFLMFFFFRALGLKRISIDGNKFEVTYPFRVLGRNHFFDLERIKHVVYVDRKDATRGNYPHSHINIHFKKSKKFEQVKIILENKEKKNLSEVLNNYGIGFSSTTKLEVNEI